MALNTYSDLKGAVAEWLERLDLAGRIPDFIALAEVRINRVYRARMGEVSVSLLAVPASRVIALPADFGEAITVWRVRDDCAEELRFIDPALMEVQVQPGSPQFWTLEAGNLAFERPVDHAYAVTLHYRKRFALSDAEPTNPILREAPDIYLFGALLEAAPYLRDGDLLNLFQVRYDAAVREANQVEHANRARTRLRVEPELAAHFT